MSALLPRARTSHCTESYQQSWLAREILVSFFLYSQWWDYRHPQPCLLLCRCWLFEYFSPGPHACRASILTYWGISILPTSLSLYLATCYVVQAGLNQTYFWTCNPYDSVSWSWDYRYVPLTQQFWINM